MNNGSTEYSKDKKDILKVIEKHLKQKDPFAFEAIECLFSTTDDDRSAFMVWSHFQKYYNIELSDEEKYLEQKWYYWFGR